MSVKLLRVGRLLQSSFWVVLGLLLLCGGWGAMAAEKPQIKLTPMGQLILQDGGRKKAFDTYARESLVKLAGRAKWKDESGARWTALEVLTDMALGTNNWRKASLIKISYIPLKTQLGLDPNRSWYSYEDIRGTPAVFQKLYQIQNKEIPVENVEKLTTQANTLSRKLHLIETLTAPGAFSWVPVSGGGMWLSVAEGAEFYKTKSPKLSETYESLRMAYQLQDDAKFATELAQFSQMLRGLVLPEVYPTGKIKMELFYNHFHPFRLAWLGLLLSFILIVGTRPNGEVYWAGIACFNLSVVLQVLGFVLRTLISGRAPVTNMYEVLVFMALGACIIAAIYELVYRSKVFALAAAAVGTITLILADNLPTVFDPSIQPLVPVLQSNWWLTVHVITITIGYAAFLQAMGIGHIAVWNYLFRPQASSTIQQLTRFNYRTMQIGVLFLAAGTLLGGLWAEKAWGRFWGWDPKETWALIALLLYLGVLHARYVGWIKGFGLNAASVLAFQGIIMAGYGVNYLLGTGKHSYGFGVGGELAVGSFVVIEIVIVILAMIRYRSMRAKIDDKPDIQ